MCQLGPRLLAWPCLALAALAQNAGVVASPAVVRAGMSDSSAAVRNLTGGERVSLGLSLAGDQGCWTEIRTEGASGYLRCEQVKKDPPPSATPNAPDPNRAAVIDTLLELSGARRQIEQLTDERQFRSLIAGASKDAQMEQLRRIFADAFRPEAFYGPVRDRLEKNLTPARTPILLQWLHSPLSRKVVDLEVKASSPDARRDLERFARRVEKEGAPQRRMNLIQRLDGALHASEFRVEMAMVLIRNVTHALGGRSVSTKSALDRLRADLWRKSRDGTLLHFLYTYQSLSDQEMEEYVRFWESENGRWFAPILHEGFLDAIRGVTDDLLTQLRRLG